MIMDSWKVRDGRANMNKSSVPVAGADDGPAAPQVGNGKQTSNGYTAPKTNGTSTSRTLGQSPKSGGEGQSSAGAGSLPRAAISCRTHGSGAEHASTGVNVAGLLGSATVEPIAIIGIGCRLPGHCNSPSKFWDMLEQKRSGYSKVPSSRFNIHAFYHPDHNRPGSMEANGGYFLNEDVRLFDPSFFGITPLEATTMDPQQRKLLEVTYEAFENGGVPIEKLSGSRTGCFVANFTSDFATIQYRDPEYSLLQPYLLTGMGLTILSNRISYAFNLCGPSLTVDTACSSSIYALHLACQSIQDGSCDGAVVAGTNLILTVDQHMASAKLGVLSPTSQCHTFDAAADGYARGEGVSALYIKRLSDAIRDGDPIRAIIRATAFNSNGKSPGGITNPSPKGQEAVIREAYQRAGLSERLWQTGYFECHGTGTKVGDPLEVAAIGKVFADGRDQERNPLLIGSVKTSVGHGEAASGITSIVKCVLAVERGVIPPTIGLKTPNPNIDFAGAKVKVVTDLTSWPATTGQIRRASINSFGYGGANAHVIIDAAPAFYTKQTIGSPLGDFDSFDPTFSKTTLGSKSRFLLPFSAHDLPTLKANVTAIRDVAESYDILDLTYTIGCRRSKFYHRGYAIVNLDPAAGLSLREQLEEGEITFGRKPGTRSTLGFIFTGQGAQWARMGAELLSEYPSFLNTIRYLDSVLGHLPDEEFPRWTLEEELLQAAKTSRINEVAISQPLCTALQIALVELLSTWNINPIAVVGHSSGEIAAAYTAGKISMESAIIAAYYRGYCCTHAKFPMEGAMLAVGLGSEEVQPYIEDFSNKRTVRIACINSPKSVTLSGDKADIESVKRSLDANKIFARPLQTGGRAYHSHHMKLVGPKYECKLSENIRVGGYGTYRQSGTIMVSSVTMKVIEEVHLPNSYWRENLESPVLFSQALERLVETFAVEQLVEIGPHSALSGPVRDVREKLGLPSAKLVYSPSLVRNQDAVTSVLTLAGTFFIRDYPLNIARINSVEILDPQSQAISIVCGKTLIDLPTYQWNYGGTLHWHENRTSEEFRNKTHLRHDLLGSRVPGSAEGEPVWRNIIRMKHLPWISGHEVGNAVIFPAAGYLAMAVEAVTQIMEVRNPSPVIAGYCLRNVSVKAAMRIPPNDPGVEVVCNVRPLAVMNTRISQFTFEFKISSVLSGKWSDNCSGTITVLVDRREPYRNWTKTHLNSKALHSSASPTKWYQGFSKIGLKYGPTFSGLHNIKVNQQLDVATATTPLHPTTGMMIGGESRYAVHPCTLDTLLQAGLIACHAKGVCTMNRCYLPVGFDEILIFSPSDPASTVASVQAAAYTSGLRTLIGNVQARVGPKEELLVDMKDLRCITLDSRTNLAQTSVEELNDRTPFLRLQWKPDIDLLSKEDATRIFPGIRKPDLTQIWENWHTLSLLMLTEITAEVTPEEVTDEFHIKHWYNWMLRRIFQSKEGAFGNIWKRAKNFPTSEERKEEISRLKRYLDPEISELQLIHNVYEQIPAILRGEVNGVQVIMVDNMSLMTDSYTQGIRHAAACKQLATVADLLGHKNPAMKVLEVGAGTGGATQIMLDALNGKEHLFKRYSNYTFTDIGKGFLGAAQERFKAYVGITYGVLDIEANPTTQGYEAGAYDLVVSSNCLHATKNIKNTLANVRKLLKPGGRLLILEVTDDGFSGSLLYGALPSYWNAVQDGRVDHPFLSKSRWDATFRQTGFSGLDIVLDDYEGHTEPTAVMLTTAIVDEVPKLSKRLPAELALIYRDQPPELLHALAEECSSHGFISTITSLASYPKLDPKPATTIVLTDLEKEATFPLIGTMTDVELQALQNLVNSCSHILWITAGGVISGNHPEHAMIQGAARTVKSELGGMKFLTLDLDLDDKSLNLDRQRDIVWQRWEYLCSCDDIHEREFAVKDGVVHISRVTGDTKLNTHFAKSQMGTGLAPELVPYDPSKPMQVDIEQPGLLDTFFFKALTVFDTPLPDDELEIEVNTAGLSLKDVISALGNFETRAMGWEYAGRVFKIGAGVTDFAEGDRVVLMHRGHLNSRVRDKAKTFIKLKESDVDEEISSMLVGYSASLYGIIDLARAQEGESILVHGGTSGLGIACIQIAQNLGLEVYTTVSTQTKAKILETQYGIPSDHIFNSKDSSFAVDIQSITFGRGVDIIILTVSGELVQESASCLASHGRIIDVGRSDVYEHGKLDLNCFRRGIAFYSFDLDDLPAHIQQRLCSKVVDLYQRGIIRPITPIETFHITEISTAMRRFGQRTGGGKVVIQFGPAPKPNTLIRAQIPPPKVQFDPNAAYLLVGCLGGLGRSLSRWMVSRGAKHLIYISRSGADKPEAADLKSELTSIGVTVNIICGDIALYSDVEQAVLASPKPIRGVVQAAMVLKDSLFANATVKAFHEGMAAKVQGTLNLHRALLQHNIELDFFVMTSSVSGYVGYISQSSYAAANAFLDAMARHRHSLGLPATSIALGVIDEVGYVVEQGSDLIAAFRRLGLASSDEAEFLALMEGAMMPAPKPTSQLDLYSNGYILTGLEPVRILDLRVETDGAILSVGAALAADVRSSTLLQGVETLRAQRSTGNSSKKAHELSSDEQNVNLKALAMKPGQEGLSALISAIRHRLATLLMLDVDQIVESKTVMEYGLDSMVGAELRNWFFMVFKVQIPFLELLDPGLSIAGLAERVKGKLEAN